MSEKAMSKAMLEKLAGSDELQQWVNKTLIKAVRLKAEEIHYERGEDGLTVQFRRGTEVLEALGPDTRFQDEAIPRLILMGQGWARESDKPGEGRFGAIVDDHEWDCPFTYTKTGTGGHLKIRLTRTETKD